MARACPLGSALAASVLAAALAIPLVAQTWEIPTTPLRAEQTPANRDFFPVAVWYSGGKSRAPMVSRHPRRERQAWLRDLRTIRTTGFNTVKTWVDWSTAEPRPGQFDLTSLRQLLALAHQVGLRVIVQVYADSAPAWVGRQNPTARFTTATGVQIHSQAAPGYPMDAPGVRRAELGFYQAVARVAAASPAFYGYDLWSEPHLVNWVWFNDLPHVQFGFNPYTQARFRRWLEKKYGGSLERLNAAWYRTYTAWGQVQAPRFGTILSYTDFLDWQDFLSDDLAFQLRAMAAAVHEVDPTHLTSSHSDIPGVLNTPLSGYVNPDDWKMAPQVDYYGASFYPKHASARFGGWKPAFRAFGYDGAYAASGGRGFYVGELQAGQGATGLRVNVPVTAADIRDWTWSLIAHGAKAICYYAWYPMNAGYESDGYGFIRLDGTLTRRARAGGAIARVVTRHATLLHQAQPAPAQIAILYNPLSYLSGGDTVGPGRRVRDSMLGFYRALWRENIPVTFIHAHQVALGGLSRYRAVYLPYAITLSNADATAIRRYVRHGGVAIGEARLAWNNARGFANAAIPGGGLAQVFGVEEEALIPGAKSAYTFLPTAPDGLAGLWLPAAEFQEDLKVTRGQVLARFADGQPAVVASGYGRGKTLFIGSFLGLAAEQSTAPDADRAIQAMARWAGISAPVRVTGAGASPAARGASQVEARLLERGGTTILVAINRGAAGQFRFAVRRPAARGVNWLAQDVPVAVRSAGGESELNLRLAHEGVAVICLQPAVAAR
ncbi:MAG: beta-galactosidase [Terriglobales bacterium]